MPCSSWKEYSLISKVIFCLLSKKSTSKENIIPHSDQARVLNIEIFTYVRILNSTWQSAYNVDKYRAGHKKKKVLEAILNWCRFRFHRECSGLKSQRQKGILQVLPWIKIYIEKTCITVSLLNCIFCKYSNMPTWSFWTGSTGLVLTQISLWVLLAYNSCFFGGLLLH